MAKEILVGLDTFSLNIMGKASIISKRRVYVKSTYSHITTHYQDNKEISESDYTSLKEEYENINT